MNQIKLLEIVQTIGTPIHDADLIADLYRKQGAKVRYGNDLIGDIEIGKAVQQG